MRGLRVSRLFVRRKGTRVSLEFECDDAYAAEIFKDDLIEKGRTGKMSLRVNIARVNDWAVQAK